jgi:protein-S-isoprenylcysteine O-methyltransferase Ste14
MYMDREKSSFRGHVHRDDLTGEHSAGDAGQVILFCLFATVWIFDTFVLGYTTFLNKFIPLVIRILIGLVFLFISGLLAKKGLSIVFGETRENPGVIRKGVFNIVRHPIYLSEILFYLGILVMSISLAASILWIAGIVFLLYISRHEEKLLLARFGEDYERYMEEVPMMVPGFSKRQE